MLSTLNKGNLLLGFASPFIIDEVVPSFHLGTSYTCASECFSDFDGMQCVELSIPTGYPAGGDLFYLHFEA